MRQEKETTEQPEEVKRKSKYKGKVEKQDAKQTAHQGFKAGRTDRAGEILTGAVENVDKLLVNC